MPQKAETVIIGSGISGLMMGYYLKEGFLILESNMEQNFNIFTPYSLEHLVPWLPTAFEPFNVHVNGWDGVRFYREPTIKEINEYSYKIAGKIVDHPFKAFDRAHEIWHLPESGNPEDMIKDLWSPIQDKIRYGSKIVGVNGKEKVIICEDGMKIEYNNLISTMSLPRLLQAMRIQNEFNFNFDSRTIFTRYYQVTSPFAHNAVQVVYVSDPAVKPYRANLSQRALIAESMEEFSNEEAASLIKQIWPRLETEPIGKERRIYPGKFEPLEKQKRKTLLGALTSLYGIYCLGRFAIWDHVITDQVASDVEKIAAAIKMKKEMHII